MSKVPQLLRELDSRVPETVPELARRFCQQADELKSFCLWWGKLMDAAEAAMQGFGFGNLRMLLEEGPFDEDDTPTGDNLEAQAFEGQPLGKDVAS